MGAEAFLDEVLNRVKEFLHHSQQSDVIRDGLAHDSLRRIIDLKLPLEGHGIESALDDIDSVLRHSVHTTAPGFMNPLWGGLSVASIAGELVTAATNTAMYTYEIAPMATFHLIGSCLRLKMTNPN